MGAVSLFIGRKRISMTMTITLIRGGRAKMTLYLPADSKMDCGRL